MPDKLDKLKQLLTIVNESITKEEFLKAFQNVISLVLKIEKDLQAKNAQATELLNRARALFQQTLEEVRRNNEETLQGLKKQVVDKLSSIKDGHNGIDGEDGVQGLPGKDGKDADETQIVDEVLKKIKFPEEEFKKLDDRITKVSQTRILAGPSADAVLSYDASTQSDGSRTAFDVPRHRKALLVVTTQAPFFYRPTVDFTTANLTLTFTGAVEPPANGQTVLFLYVK